MRVTQGAATRHFLNRFNNNLNAMNRVQGQIESERRFSRVSEDTISATRAMKTRRSLADIQIYEDNLKTAESILSIGEKVIMNISEATQEVHTKFLAAITGTNSSEEREIYASEMDEQISEMVKNLNIDYAGRYVFSGTNNGSPPFNYDKKAGIITFNGININGERNGINSPLEVTSDKYKILDTNGNPISFEKGTLSADGSQLRFTGENGVTTDIQEAILVKQDYLKTGTDGKNYGSGSFIANEGGLIMKTTGFPYSEPILVDVGMGMNIKRYDIDGNLDRNGSFYKVDPQSCLDISLNGADIMGSKGIDSDGDPTNILGLMLEMKDMLSNDNFSSTIGRRILDKYSDSTQSLLVSISEVGNRTAFIQSSVERIEDNRLVYQTDQVAAEATNIPSAMIEFTSLKNLHNAILQMGQKLIPMSLFDFIR